jgi:hypothetical protein
VAALSLTGTLPPAAARRNFTPSLADGRPAPLIPSDDASTRRARINERARLRAALPRVHNREVPGGGITGASINLKALKSI